MVGQMYSDFSYILINKIDTFFKNFVPLPIFLKYSPSKKTDEEIVYNIHQN